jgi:hypothetical protein
MIDGVWFFLEYFWRQITVPLMFFIEYVHPGEALFAYQIP